MPLGGRLSGRSRHRIAYAVGALASATCIWMLLSSDYERWRSPGPANAGHESLACSECHREAKGSVRQQLQTNVRWMLGLAKEQADFGLIAVSSEDCAACHQRPSDRHPIYRFVEPRFAKVRDAIAPQRCTSCHREHTGRRVTIQNGFCKHCHAGLSIPNDPAEPTHEGIVQAEAWTTCLRCHDFHGNHDGEAPKHLIEAVSVAEIDRYLSGGASPYATRKHHPAQKTRLQ